MHSQNHPHYWGYSKRHIVVQRKIRDFLKIVIQTRRSLNYIREQKTISDVDN